MSIYIVIYANNRVKNKNIIHMAIKYDTNIIQFATYQQKNNKINNKTNNK